MKRNLILFSAAFLIGAIFYSWQLHEKTRGAEAALAETRRRLAGLATEEQRLVARVSEVDRQNAALQLAVARPQVAPTGVAVPAAKPAPPADAVAAQRSLEALVLQNPKVQGKLIATFRAKSAIGFAPFFNQRQLTPVQIEQFEAIMAQIAWTGIDLKAAEQNAGTAAPAVLTRGYRDEVFGALTKLLGEDGFALYRQYQRAVAPHQKVVDELAGEMAITDSPLTATQAAQLSQVLADASSTYQRGAPPTRESIDWAQALARAQGVLSPSQFACLQTTADVERARARIASGLRDWMPK